MEIIMYTFICEDSPNGIFSGVYDAWAFKIQQNKQMPDGGRQSGSRAAGQTRCTHDDIRLTSREPDNYELFSQYFPVTPSAEKSDKVARTLCARLGTEFYETVMNALLAVIPERKGEIDKADAIYHTVVLALSSPAGANTLHRLNHPHVHRVFTLSRATANEAHHLLGFLRFRELENGVLFSTIHPKNNALPILAEHFTDRLPQENFIIYDENRRQAAVHAAGKDFMLADASDLDEAMIKQESCREAEYQSLWLAFFENIAIRARVNPKLQAQNIPKRFWCDTIELSQTGGGHFPPSRAPLPPE